MRTSRMIFRQRFAGLFAPALFSLCFTPGAANAQTPGPVSPGQVTVSPAEVEVAALPEAPQPAARPVAAGPPATSFAALEALPQAGAQAAPPARFKHTSPYDHLIDPQEIPVKLTAGDKIIMGVKSSVSPFAVIGWVGSATYSEAFNRSPNYGQSPKDYLQRIGAAAARASSQGIFSTSVMAPVLHEDPRYFVMGPGHSGLHRAYYAISRVWLTQSDSGHGTVNYALLSGNAIGAALTQTYYPAGNRDLRETATTFGTSLGGSAVKFLFEEFFYKEASIAQLKKRIETF